MDRLLQERVERAKWLLTHVKHAAMATVNADGTPHNTPYFFMANAELTELYWSSHPESQHSLNVERTGQLFVVLYDAHEGGGLYIKASQGRIAEGEELLRALERHNALRARQHKTALELDYYRGESPQRMWIADTEQFWVNHALRGQDGLIIRDMRHEIDRAALA